MRNFFSSITTLVFIGSLWIAPLQADTIFLKRGKPLENCNVLKETFTECHYRLAGVPATVTAKMADVEKIEYDDIPDNFKQAEDARNSGNLDRAKDLYINFLKEEKSEREKNVFEFKAYYWLAYCLQNLASSQKSFDKFISGAEKYYQTVTGIDCPLIGEALVGLIECKLIGNDYKGAQKAAEELRDKKLSDYWNLQSELYQSHILYLQKNYKDASRKYDSLASRARRDAKKVYGLALLGKANCELAGGDEKEAKKLFEEVLENSDIDEALAGAYNGLGDLYRKEKKNKESLMAYLRVVVNYPHIRSELPKALHFAGRAFIALKDENSEWGARGNTLVNRQKDEFPGWKN